MKEVNNILWDSRNHAHTHSLYVRCLACFSFGIDTPTEFAEAAICGNCSSSDTVKYYPNCCILDALAALPKETK